VDAAGDGCTLTVRRPKAVWRDRIRSYQIEVDGKVVGEIFSDSELVFSLPPGEHTVRATIDSTGSQLVRVVMSPKSSTDLLVKAAGNSLHALRQMKSPDTYLILGVERDVSP
jgi:hypothetical protein